MAELVLGPMLRHVSSTSATIWVATDEACTLDVLGRRTDSFCVGGRHYGLIVIEGLEPGTTIGYEVRVDGEVRWPPPDSTFPVSRIRTLPADHAPRVVFGSCRTAAPHDAPWSLETGDHADGLGVDAVRTYALRMLEQRAADWPDLAVFLGDQVYADEASPGVRARIAAHRRHEPASTLPPRLVRGFEEFCWLYEESWSSEVERWFFSVVPSVMIFDDHDMIDDWNISAAWVADIHREGWWAEHVLGGLMTYWVYQHLGNLSPAEIRCEGILAAVQSVPDGYQVLNDWARSTEEFTSGPDRYRFSFVRDLGRVRLVMIDARNGRVLTPGARRIIDDVEWAWIVEQCHCDVDHLLIGSSLPVFAPGGLHDLQVWNAAVCDGAWGAVGSRVGEWLRRTLDLEDWPAYVRSFDDMIRLLIDVGGHERESGPVTISLLSGDIHFSYLARVAFPAHAMRSRVAQLVNSPIRNVLPRRERLVMRASMSRFARWVGRLLRRSVRQRPPQVTWTIDRGPIFANSIGTLDYTGSDAVLRIEQVEPYLANASPSLTTAIAIDL